MFLRRLTHLVTCKEATRLISQLQDRPLERREWIRLRVHLAFCNACSRFARQMRFMRAALRAYRSDTPPRP